MCHDVRVWNPFRKTSELQRFAESRDLGPAHLDVASPWTPSGLTPNIVVADIVGKSGLLTRAEAMTVPAVAKARHLVCTTLSRYPLVQYKGDERTATQPTWLYRTDGDTPVQMRTMYLLDDLFFYGFGLLALRRGSSSSAFGPVLDAVRVPPARWEFDEVGRIKVDGEYPDGRNLALVVGPFEGMLVAGYKTITGALALEDEWQKRVKNPTPITELHNVDGTRVLSREEAKETVANYNAARRDPEGTTVYTPQEIDLRVHGDVATDLFVQGRNAVTLDVARMTGLPADALDASQVSAALTYQTTTESRNVLVDTLTNMWAQPLEARFSMDDLTPRGTRIAFDLTNLLAVPQAATGPATED
jgi:hypothetical protein